MKELFEEAALTYSHVLEIVDAWEAAEKSLVVEDTGSTLEVGNVQRENRGNVKYNRNSFNYTKRKNRKCTSCSLTNHTFFNCFQKDKDCSYCNRKGRLASVCFKNPAIKQKIHFKIRVILLP